MTIERELTAADLERRVWAPTARTWSLGSERRLGRLRSDQLRRVIADVMTQCQCADCNPGGHSCPPPCTCDHDLLALLDARLAQVRAAEEAEHQRKLNNRKALEASNG
jgi:hypothetical protein